MPNPEDMNIEDTKQANQETAEVKTEDTQRQTSEQDTKVENQTKDGFFKSTMSYIREKLASKDEDVQTEDTTTTLAETDIPDDFSNFAEELGWTGDEIIEFASKGNNGKAFTDEELHAMVPDLLTASEKEDDKDKDAGDTAKKVDSTEQTGDQTKDKDGDDNTALREQLKKEILEELNVDDIRGEIKKSQEERRQQQESMLINRANEIFDSVKDELDDFGLTSELPKYPAGTNKGRFITSSPAFQARNEVYSDALAFMSHYGTTLDEAMAKSLDTYRGKHLKERTKQKVVKDLKAQEQNLSGPRTGKEVKKTYDSKRDEEIDYIRSLQRAQGQDV